MIEKGNKKIINGWAFYDWANSAYPLVITTAIFPIYYNAVTSKVAVNDFIDVFGFPINTSALYSYTFSASFLIVAFLSPLLSGIADYSGSKKKFLQFFCYLGAISCASLYFFSAEHIEWSLLSVIGASLGFWGSIVFYNAYLPEIAEPKDHDRISARGFSLGYLGSSILLIINLVNITFPSFLFDVSGYTSQLMAENPQLTEPLAIEKATGHFKGVATRWAFVSVAVWWVGFAQITFARLPNNPYNRKPEGRFLYKGFQELRAVWNELRTLPRLKRFLVAFFVYSMGVQTVLLMAVNFADKEINWEGDGKTGLIVSVLIIQFIAILGSFVFSRLSMKFGNIYTLISAVMVWAGVCWYAYTITKPHEFYITAAIVGFVMGGIQALSRSTYSKYLPDTKDHTSYFSFYDVLEKIGLVLGLVIYGGLIEATGSVRNSILGLISIFVVGLVLLLFVPKDRRAA